VTGVRGLDEHLCVLQPPVLMWCASRASFHIRAPGHDCMLHLRPRPHLLPRPSLFELTTRKNIDHLSDLRTLVQHLGLPDLIQDIDEFASSSETVLLSRPINYLHSTVKTIRMAPSKSNSSGGEKQTGTIFSISGPVIVAENMIGCAMYELVGCPSATRYLPLRAYSMIVQSRL
jgi:hypothetical protein